MKVVVSLTSFPAAVHLVPAAVRSILAGSVLPDRVVLYLAEEQFPGRRVPAEIEGLTENPLFEVRWTQEDIRSYKKLVPALHDFPDDIIVTVDDDLRFHPRMLERLLGTHKKYPDAIVGHRVRRIKIGRDGTLAPYRKWKRYKEFRFLTRSLRPSFRNLLTGGAGGLYPPHSLAAEMLDPQLFMSIAPTVDDVWFWAAAVAAGTRTVPVPWGYVKLHETGKPTEITLSHVNLNPRKDVNRMTVEAIMERFPIIAKRVVKDEK
jgi:hypothetical protein